jgi:hypothetical protein
MSDHERGAYTPPTDAPLSFDPRQPVRGTRPIPFTLIISILVLLGLAVAIFFFYSSGVRQAGQPPHTVGTPVGGIKAPPPAEAQPQDPAAGLQIYRSENGQPAQAAGQPKFTPPPELPEARPQPAAPNVVITPGPPAGTPPANVAPPLRPAISPPTALPPARPAPEARIAPPAPLAPVAQAPAQPPPARPAPAQPMTIAKILAAPPPAPTSGATGAAAVQIGAFSSQALADKGWNDAAAIAPGAAAGKGKHVEQIQKDGHTLFRTTVTGFASHADATAFCERLKAAGKACFVK